MTWYPDPAYFLRVLHQRGELDMCECPVGMHSSSCVETPGAPIYQQIGMVPDAGISPESDSRKFFMVWRAEGHFPTVRHFDYEKARNEAERLAEKHKDDKIYILTANGYCQVEKPSHYTRLK